MRLHILSLKATQAGVFDVGPDGISKKVTKGTIGLSVRLGIIKVYYHKPVLKGRFHVNCQPAR